MTQLAMTHDRIQELKARQGGSATGPKNKAAEACFPKSDEPMLIHPGNHSMVKIRDNGCIDVFVEGNHGIRIDPKAKLVTLMSDNVKHIAKDIRSIVSANVAYEVKKSWSVKAENVTINAKGKVALEAAGAMSIKAKSLSLNIAGPMTASATGYDWS